MRDVFQVLGLCIKNLWDLSDAGLRLQQGRGSRLQNDAVQCNGWGGGTEELCAPWHNGRWGEEGALP